jgi:hypothetical protein
MPDMHNGDELSVITNGIDYPVMTLPYSPQISAFDPFNASWPRCVR